MNLISIMAIALAVTGLSFQASAKSKRNPASSGYMGGQLKGAAACSALINMQLMDFSGGFDMDGTSMRVDQGGKLQIDQPQNIVSRSLENGVETIVYKQRQMKPGFYDPTKKPDFETVQKTVVIKHDSTGKITGISKLADVAGQLKMRDSWKKDGMVAPFPIMKAINTEFAYNGENCDLNQTIGIESTDGKAEEKQVYFDKEFCDRIAPSIKQMGSQNASLCGNLLNSAQAAFDNRNTELKKEGKVMKQYNFFGQAQSGNRNYSDVFNVSTAIQSCSMAGMAMYGPYGGVGMFGSYGFPTMGGYGMVMGGGGMMMGGVYPMEGVGGQKAKKESSQ